MNWLKLTITNFGVFFTYVTRRTKAWIGNAAGGGMVKNTYVLFGKPQGRNVFVDTGADGRIILK